MRTIVSLDEVEVIVSGPLPRLELLGPEDVRVVLDVTGLLPGSHVVQPTVVVPDGIVKEGVIPEAIEVLIESLITPTPTPEPVPETAEPPSTPDPGTGDTPPAGETAVPSPVPEPETTEPPPTETPEPSN